MVFIEFCRSVRGRLVRKISRLEYRIQIPSHLECLDDSSLDPIPICREQKPPNGEFAQTPSVAMPTRRVKIGPIVLACWVYVARYTMVHLEACRRNRHFTQVAFPEKVRPQTFQDICGPPALLERE